MRGGEGMEDKVIGDRYQVVAGARPPEPVRESMPPHRIIVIGKGALPCAHLIHHEVYHEIQHEHPHGGGVHGLHRHGTGKNPRGTVIDQEEAGSGVASRPGTRGYSGNAMGCLI
jgi:hypothetical protein